MGGFLQPASSSASGSSGSGGIGAPLAFAPASGTIDPSITGFIAVAGPTGTGRLQVTLSGNTSFEGLPAGADGQQLFIEVIAAGADQLTLLHLNGSTAQKQIFASRDVSYVVGDVAQLYYDGGTSQWVLVV